MSNKTPSPSVNRYLDRADRQLESALATYDLADSTDDAALKGGLYNMANRGMQAAKINAQLATAWAISHPVDRGDDGSRIS